jgi:hypothetical protein
VAELVGDGRLTETLATCEENGWDALPLAPTALHDLFPELRGTEKAAERWLGNNPDGLHDLYGAFPVK